MTGKRGDCAGPVCGPWSTSSLLPSFIGWDCVLDKSHWPHRVFSFEDFAARGVNIVIRCTVASAAGAMRAGAADGDPYHHPHVMAIQVCTEGVASEGRAHGNEPLAWQPLKSGKQTPGTCKILRQIVFQVPLLRNKTKSISSPGGQIAHDQEKCL